MKKLKKIKSVAMQMDDDFGMTLTATDSELTQGELEESVQYGLAMLEEMCKYILAHDEDLTDEMREFVKATLEVKPY